MFQLLAFSYLYHKNRSSAAPRPSHISQCYIPKVSTKKYVLFAFDIDDTITCGQAAKAIEIVKKQPWARVGLVTARPVWPVDTDIRIFHDDIQLPDATSIPTCYRGNKRDSVEATKTKQLIHLLDTYKSIYFFDDRLRTIRLVRQIASKNRLPITAYHVDSCNVLDKVKLAITSSRLTPKMF